MANVIRQDVIEIGFKSDLGTLNKINDGMDKLKKSVSNDVDGGLSKLKKSADSTKKSISALGKEKGISKLKKDIEMGGAAIDVAKDKVNSLKKSIKGITSHPIKTLDKKVLALQMSAGKTRAEFKRLQKEKLSKLKSNISKVKDTLTDGEKGAKGFKNAIKNIGKVGVSKTLSGFERLKKSMANGVRGSTKFKTKLKSIDDTSMAKLKNSLQGVSNKLSTIGKKAAGVAFRGLKKIAGISLKAITGGIAACATAIGGLTANSVTAYADYEQLIGGVETLLGAKGAKSVQEYAKLTGKSVGKVKGEYKKLNESQKIVVKNANNAFKTAGLSANDYMETVTGFAASLLQSTGNDTKKAAKLADVAVSDMADNANKMGTDMSSIQWAYQGFAKQNYTMLDNLKLGYGGTKTEMQRLVKDASKLDKSIDGNSLSYGNIVKAIHAVQKETGIYGTTQKEAEHTIQGSLNSMKSAWGNLMPALIQGGDAFDQCVDNLIDTTKIFVKNIKPAIIKSLTGIGKLIEELAPIIEKEFPKLVDELLPPLLRAATSLVKGLIVATPNIIKVIVAELPNIARQLSQAFAEAFGIKFPAIEKVANLFKNSAKTLTKAIPYLLGLVAVFKILKTVSSFKGMFGGKGGEGGSLFDGITNIFKGLAQTKTSTILKGMANLAIIIGGMTAITVAFMAVAPYMAQLSDGKTVLKMVALVGALGLVGTGLAKLASIVGVIPISVVLKGIANIALVVASMSALYLLIGAVSLIEFDLTRLTKVAVIIGVLGTVGSALTAFAGLVGMIPIPVVLRGLANIALVIGGMTALITAYGALAQIPKFNEFISKGGDTLANLFNQIGKIAGALVGGLGEGISASLPTIGKNLTAFARAIAPMFTLFKGVDMSGIGSFFSAVGGFMLKMTGNNLLSKLTGGTNLGDVGTQLTTFINNASGFFTKVATLPANGFTNAKLLFKSLADIGNVPKTGGLAQWFGGETDFSSLASGLAKMSGKGVIGFYTKVAKLPQAGFANAKALFKSLADIGKLPKTGGIKQWFTGENDISGLASKLPPFGSAMARFYNSISGIKDMSKISSLFKALKSINGLPKKGGLKQLFTGKNDISGIGTALKNFGANIKGFISQVNKINLSNLNGLWKSLKQPSKITSSSLKTVTKNCNSMVAKAKQLPSKMGNAIKSTGNSLANAITSIWNRASKASIRGANKVISTANGVLGQIGAKSKLSTVSYANGTNGHKGGNALVNDGRGAELVQMPNGQSFIPKGRNVLIPNAPKGMKVLPADRTAQIMGRKSATYNYAKGTGNFDAWEYIDNPKGLTSYMRKNATYGNESGFPLKVGKGVVNKITGGAMTSWLKKKFDEMGALSLANYDASKGVAQWRTTVIRALKMEGQYSAENVKRTLYQMQTESGGNPRAINKWDSNAKKGTPSKGLMQVIDPTFRAYARKGYNKNIYDPLSNILASIRYAVSRYGSLARAYQGHGYSNGGLVTKTGLIAEKNKPEWVIPTDPAKRKRSLNLWQQAGNSLGVRTANYSPESGTSQQGANRTENNTYAPVFNLTVSGTSDDRTTARKVKKWVQEAMEEVFEGIATKNPKVKEV
jgi:SLT domain-containing protein/phage-related protein